MTQATATPTILEGELRQLKVEELFPSSTNPRKTFDAAAMKDLTENVRHVGVLQPLLVRPVQDRYEVVDGERRYRAAKGAELLAVPCYVRELTDVQVLEHQLIINREREEIHPLEEADGYRRYMKTAKLDADGVAAKIGMSKAHVYARLKLLELVPQAAEAFRAGELTAGHAVIIARLTAKDQAAALTATLTEHRVDRQHGPHAGYAHAAVKAAIPVRALEAWVKTNLHLELTRAPWDPGDALLVGPGADAMAKPKAGLCQGACAACAYNTDNAPELFPELKRRAGVCTNTAGFGYKLDAYVEKRKAEARATLPKGEKLVEVSLNDYRHGDKGRGLLKRRQWVPSAGKACEQAARGIVVEGSEERANPYASIGTTFGVCLGLKDYRVVCKVHQERHAPAPYQVEDRKRREKEKVQRKTREATRAAIYAAIFEAKRWIPTVADWTLLLEQALGGVADDSAGPVLAAIAGVDLTKLKRAKRHGLYADPVRDALKARLPKLDPDDRLKLLTAAALAEEVDRYHGHRGPDALLEAAKAHKVNVAAIAKANAPARKLTAKEKRALLKRGKVQADKDKKALAAVAAGLERVATKLAGKKGPGPTERKLRAKGLTTGKAVKAALTRAGKKAKTKRKGKAA